LAVLAASAIQDTTLQMEKIAQVKEIFIAFNKGTGTVP